MNNQEYLVQLNVDVQNDFCPGGNLAVAEGGQVVRPLNRLGRFVRQRSGLVVFTKDFHPIKTSHFNNWPVHCVAGTQGAELHRELEVETGDVVVTKGTLPGEDGFSGFEDRDSQGRSLEEVILEAADSRLIKILIGGLATDYCVKATVFGGLDLKERRRQTGQTVEVYALTDAMRAVNLQPHDGQKALEDMQGAGAILATTQEIMARTALRRLGATV